MKRMSFVCLALFLFVSCTKNSALPPSEVMEKTILASKLLDASHFRALITAEASQPIALGLTNLSLRAEGNMMDGGNMLAFLIQVEGVDERGIASAMNIDGDVVIDRGNTYLYFREYAPLPMESLIVDDEEYPVIGTWWNVANKAQDVTMERLTPDPEMLRMQASIMDIVKDHGMTSLNEHDVYHYDVQLNPVKLQSFLQNHSTQSVSAFPFSQATGEIWIDAMTFIPHRIRWELTFETVPNAIGTIDMHFTEHNKPVQITIPDTSHQMPVDALFSGNSIDVLHTGIE